MDEEVLVARARRGDAASERELFETHVDRIYRLAYRMTGDDDQAQEFTQETFIRAFERIDQFRGDAAFGTWLNSIGTSVIYNGLRKVTRFRQRDAAGADSVQPRGGKAAVGHRGRRRRVRLGLGTQRRHRGDESVQPTPRARRHRVDR